MKQFKQVAEETAAWVMREMQSPEGGYYSTIDADSEHEEGKFYVWLPEEARQYLLPEEYAVIAALYGLDGPANFEDSHWHLRDREIVGGCRATIRHHGRERRETSCERAAKIIRRARKAHSSRSRRKNSRQLERLDD